MRVSTINCDQCGCISVQESGGMKAMGRGRSAIGIIKESTKKTITKQDKKDLKVLADDFGLLYRKEVQEIIETCKSYAEGQQKIMRVYEAVYLH